MTIRYLAVLALSASLVALSGCALDVSDAGSAFVPPRAQPDPGTAAGAGAPSGPGADRGAALPADPRSGARPAGGAPRPPAGTPGAPAVGQPAAQPTLRTCAPELAWAVDDPIWSYGPHRMAISPNGAILARAAGEPWEATPFRRLSTGEPMFDMPAHWLAPMDFGWGIRLVRSQTAVEARTVLTDQLIGVVPLLQAEPGQSVEHAVALSTTGRVIATLTCVSPGSDTPEELRYRAVRLPEGAERAGALAVPCNGWPSPLQLRISPDDQLLVFTDAVGSAHSVSIDDGAMASADIAPPPDETSWYPYSAPIVDLAVTPSSDGVYLVTWDGTVQRRALPGLALEGTPHPAGLGTLDIDSYMPSVVSPLAVSADGTLLAYLLPEPPPGDGTGSPWSAVARRIAITDIATGALLSTLDAPELNPEQADFLGWSATTPAALAFTADGTGLVASLDQGVALWRCSDAAWPEPAAALTVTLAAPTTAHAGVGTALVATHVGDDNLHSHAFFANGEPIAPPSIERDVVWAPAAPGTVVVTVVVDDGMATGEASQTVTVLP